MLRRKNRERREYLYRKAVEDRHRTIQDKKDRVKNALASNKLLDTDVKRDALELAKSGAWDDAGPDLALAMGGSGGGTLANSQDDEYRSEKLLKFMIINVTRWTFLRVKFLRRF